MLKIEGLNIAFDKEAISEMAKSMCISIIEVSLELNEEEDIGARRLRTVIDSVLEEISFRAPDLKDKSFT